MREKFKNYFIDLTTKQLDYESNKNSKLYLLAGFLFFILCIVILEIRQPLYFTQDDSYSMGLPLYLEFFKNLFDHGIFTTLNPYQFTGSPVSEILAGILYPLTYICYMFARFILHNDLYFIEVYSIANLTMCYFTFYIACRCLKVRPSIAVLCSLFYSLSGYSLIITRCWCCFPPVMAFSPLIVPIFNYLKDKSSSSFSQWKWFFLTGIFLGMVLLAGCVQMNVYLLIFMLFAVIIMLIFKQITFKRALYSIPAVILGIAIAFPNLFVTYDLLSRVNRGGVTYGDWNSLILPALFLPYPFYLILPAKNWIPFARGELFFSGGLNALLITVIFPIFSVLSLKVKKNFILEILKNNIYILLAFIALSLCLGEKTITWKLLHSFPIMNSFRGSFKLILFFNLFSILALSIFLERIYLIFNVKRIYKICFTAFSCSLICYTMFVSLYAFWFFNINFFLNKESYYPEVLKSQDSFRIYPLAYERSMAPNYLLTMMLNFPTYKKIHSLIGYRDVMESDLPENLIIYKNIYTGNLFGMFKAYGVKYLLLEESFAQTTSVRTRSGIINIETFLNSALKKVYSKNGINYYEFPAPDPLAFVFNHPEKPIPIKFNGQGAVVNVSSLNKPEKIVINMLLRPNMNIFDDKKIHIDVQKDKWGRIIANINGKSKTITVQYMPKWGLGFELGALLLLLSILTMRGIIYLNKPIVRVE